MGSYLTYPARLLPWPAERYIIIEREIRVKTADRPVDWVQVDQSHSLTQIADI